MHILGVSAYFHDSAAALLRDGELVAAAQEERFSRRKHDADFPAQAIAYCLREGCLRPEEIDLVVFYEKPLLKFDRLLETYLSYAPLGFRSFSRAMPLWLTQKLHIGTSIRKELDGFTGRLLWAKHHLAHAASAFFLSPFEEAAILTADGVGEWATTAIAQGSGSRIRLLEEIRFPHSLGLFYSAFTYFCGFRVNSGEYKLMGLAPYGRPRYKQKILSEVIDLREDGSFWLNMEFFDYGSGLKMTSARFDELFDGPPRSPESLLTQREMDIAASAQEVLEEAMIGLARRVKSLTGARRLCLAGGVALNCVANARIWRESDFEELFIQPAAGDAGGALGAAFLAWHDYLGEPRRIRRPDSQRGSLLGPQYSDGEIGSCLDACGASYHRFDDEDDLLDAVVSLLVEEKVVGWFQGRMEFGPRALGARSILADARSPRMQSDMNLKIKFRESFRPFAPVVRREKAASYFDLDGDSPYMLLVAPVREERRLPAGEEDASDPASERIRAPRSVIPAVTHVDFSARVQTVDRETHPRLYRLLEIFERRTGCGVLVNTSFNVRGEPIVNRPEEAYRCFLHTGMDALVMGSFLALKDGRTTPEEAGSYVTRFALD